MTTAPPATDARKRKQLLIALLVALLATAAVVGYFAWWHEKVVVPEIRTAGRDAEVAAAINKAHAEVESHPDSAEAWGRLGLVLFANDMYEECIEFMLGAERLNSIDARWPY